MPDFLYSVLIDVTCATGPEREWWENSQPVTLSEAVLEACGARESGFPTRIQPVDRRDVEALRALHGF